MSKKMVDGIEMSDDVPVTEYDGKLSGTFELDHEKAAKMGYDDIVYFVVTARLDSYSFKPTKFGDLKRVNTFKIDSVSVKSHDEAGAYEAPEFVQPTLVAEEEIYWSASDDEMVQDFSAPEPAYAGGFQVLEKEPEITDTAQVVSGGREYKDPILAKFLDEM